MLGFINAKCQGAKNLKLQSLIEFPWEKEDDKTIKEKSKPMTMEDYERLKKQAQYLIDNNILNNITNE